MKTQIEQPDPKQGPQPNAPEAGNKPPLPNSKGGNVPSEGAKPGAPVDPKAKPPAPAKGQGPGPKGPAGPPKPDAGPEPLPEGVSPELASAYEFLENYIKNPENMQQLNVAQMPDVGTDSILNQIGKTLPQTIAGAIKNYPNFSIATGSTPSPQLQTGVMPPNLVGGLNKMEVAMNQIPLPISKKA